MDKLQHRELRKITVVVEPNTPNHRISIPTEPNQLAHLFDKADTSNLDPVSIVCYERLTGNAKERLKLRKSTKGTTEPEEESNETCQNSTNERTYLNTTKNPPKKKRQNSTKEHTEITEKKALNSTEEPIGNAKEPPKPDERMHLK
ncbi:5442_t:CDS:2, partial [Scutellospora calospora]